MAAGCRGKHKAGARTTQVQTLALPLRTVDCGSPFTTLSSCHPLRNGTTAPTSGQKETHVPVKHHQAARGKATILLLNQRWERRLHPRCPRQASSPVVLQVLARQGWRRPPAPSEVGTETGPRGAQSRSLSSSPPSLRLPRPPGGCAGANQASAPAARSLLQSGAHGGGRY